MIPSREALLKFLLQKAAQPLSARDLLDQLKVTPADEVEFLRFLDDLTRAGNVVEIKGGQYAHPSRVGLVVGRVQVHPDGFGFVISDDRDQADLFVKPRWLRAVMNGDRVVARVEAGGRRPEGRIIRLLTRANERVIGKVQVQKKRAVVVPLDERLLHQIYVSPDELGGAADGQIVQVELTAYPTEEAGPEGRIAHVLGVPGEPDVEAKAIALKHGVRVEFGPEFVSLAEKAPSRVRPADLKGREDLRSLPFVTIDGEKARDFDDAVCLEPQTDGTACLWVAIADVSHYVREGTELDAEAYERGTSTYFPDRVFPMLPERLSNGICSLNPREDRLVMVAEMGYSRGGRRNGARFFPAVIRSRHRLTYTAVAQILDDPDCEESRTLTDVVPSLLAMGELARAIRSRRRDRGSIDFDLPEAEIVLDLQGKPEDIVKSERNWAHFLIEEFMIAANEAVAEFLEEHRIPCPYRVHAEPANDRVEEFRRFVHNFGYTLKGKQKLHPRDFQDLARQVEGKPEERMVNQVMLRTMQKAVYSPVNIGHFGLASTHYAHFTSPIRRYPDLILHRHLKAALKGKRLAKGWKDKAGAYLEEACPHLSGRERASEAAEREAVTWKKCQFMADKVASTFWGYVTGVASFGFFVQLEDYFVDGLVHVSSLKDDFYAYSEPQQALIGERTKRSFRIGDRFLVRVDRVDVERRQIDFTLAAPLAPPAPPTAPVPPPAQGRKTRKPRKGRRT
ncbi:MAG: ribonuclease R [Deltaproteobacteria bacterium]|nr:ribonuclease R [Deltaproteobacteria bacterium]